MNESTQSGDSVEVNTVDDAAQALAQRYAKHNQPVKVEQEVEQEVEEQAEEAEEAEEGEAPEEIKEETTEDAEGEPEARFESIEELAEATGMELEEFLDSITLETKVDGKADRKTLKDVKKGYQLEDSYTRKNEAFIAQKKDWEAEQTETRTRINADLERAGQAFKIAQNQYLSEFNAIDWQALERDDPQRYLLERQKHGEKRAALEAEINRAAQHAQQVAERFNQETEAKTLENLGKEDELLKAAIPDWNDANTREKESAKVSEYLINLGYKPEEVQTITDHRVIKLAYTAMNSQEISKDIDLAKKKVRKAPKLLKPNARQNPQNSKQATIKKAETKAQQTGTVNDVAAALIARRS